MSFIYLTLLCPTRLVLGNLAAWSHSACVVYPSEMFDPKAIVEAVEQERCTALHGVPTHFLGVLAEVQRRQEAGEKLDLSRLRWVVFTTSGEVKQQAKLSALKQDRHRRWIPDTH